MPNPGLLLGGLSLGGSVLQAKAAKDSAKTTGRAADQATQLQRDIFNQTSANFAPYLSAGTDAMSAYLYEMGLGPKPTVGGTAQSIEAANGAYKVGEQEFKTLAEAETYAKKNKTGGSEYGGYSMSPMAKYLMSEGTDSIQGSAAAGGGLFSGATLQALEDNRRTVVGADTSDYFSKLFGVANMGMGAAGNQATAGSTYAGNAGNLAMEAAKARSSGYIGAANAASGAMGDIAGIYGYFSNPMAAYASPTLFGGNSWGA